MIASLVIESRAAECALKCSTSCSDAMTDVERGRCVIQRDVDCALEYLGMLLLDAGLGLDESAYLVAIEATPQSRGMSQTYTLDDEAQNHPWCSDALIMSIITGRKLDVQITALARLNCSISELSDRPHPCPSATEIPGQGWKAFCKLSYSQSKLSVF